MADRAADLNIGQKKEYFIEHAVNLRMTYLNSINVSDWFSTLDTLINMRAL